MRSVAAVLLVAIATAFASAQPTPELCASDALPIGTVQGTERRSPYVGESVTVVGTVAASFPQADGLQGFFLQDVDGNPTTSDGIFVRQRGAAPVAAGSRVAIRGTVLERNEMTQIDRIDAIAICGYSGLVTPTAVSLPVPDLDAWERFEGMLVAFRDPLVIAETYNVGRYGELLLASERLFNPMNAAGDPTVPNALQQIVLNDASTVENPDPVPYLAPDLTVRVGDVVEDLEAVVVSYGFQAYRLEPVVPPRIVRANPRPARPADVGGDVQVGAFNVLNYFTSLSERGADDPAELQRQTDKLVAALIAGGADAYGLMEIENDGGGAAQALVDALNATLGTDTWTVMPDPATGVGTDQIKQAIIYRRDALELEASTSDPSPVHDRPPVAGTFRHHDTDEVFSMVVVHFKSKGSCPPAGDIDEGFGCWNLRRAAQAQATLDFAAGVADEVDDPDVLILGDLNAYRAEPPVRAFTTAGWLNLDEGLPEEERYTYVYFGESGTLDYALASPSLAEQVSGMVNWHINADEPPVVDYDLTYNPPYLYRPFPFRSSDHDPVLVGLDLQGR